MEHARLGTTGLKDQATVGHKRRRTKTPGELTRSAEILLKMLLPADLPAGQFHGVKVTLCARQENQLAEAGEGLVQSDRIGRVRHPASRIQSTPTYMKMFM